MTPLSGQQVILLRLLYEWYQRQDPQTRDRVGVPWGPGLSRVRTASVSRSLRRLEQRGLLQRLTICHGAALRGQRTTNIILSPSGLALAQQWYGEHRANRLLCLSEVEFRIRMDVDDLHRGDYIRVRLLDRGQLVGLE